MSITFDSKRRIFHIHTPRMSYLFGISDAGKLLHLYWGAPLSTDESEAALYGKLHATTNAMSLVSDLQHEFPTQEPYDFSTPALLAVHSDGVRSTRLIFKDYKIDEAANKLTVTLRDEHYPLEVDLIYAPAGELPLMDRHCVIRNTGDTPVMLDIARSAAWHLPHGQSYRITHFAGDWAAEYGLNRFMLTEGKFVIDSARLTKQSLHHIPFFAADARGEATDQQGEVWFGSLCWSGDFSIIAEQQFALRACISGGVNDFDTSWTLRGGESYETPAFMGGFSEDGFDGMSRVLYDWQLDILAKRRIEEHKVQPVLYNLWYPFEMDIDEKKALSLVDKAADLGIELFVIDDGWFKGRQSVNVGLGDWVPDPVRFPHGMGVISRACHAKGMKFGLWVEPEMVDPDSDLYRAHPDWVLGERTRTLATGRGEYILNIARDEVLSHILKALDTAIDEGEIDYLKWDVNRYVTEKGWPDAPEGDERSLSVRWMRAIYRIWRHLNERHPNLILENCAGGGGRADYGLMPFCDRINRSDNADPADVMILHEGFSRLFLPRYAGGAGTVAPNVHHLGRRATPLDFRIDLGTMGAMSIGLNLNDESEETLARLKTGIDRYKSLRADLHDAYVYRLASASDGPFAVFEYVKRDGGFIGFFAFSHGSRYWDRISAPVFRLRGLPEKAVYEDTDATRYTGESLMRVGLRPTLGGDYVSDTHFLKRIN